MAYEFGFYPEVLASQLLMGRRVQSWGWYRKSSPGENQIDANHSFIYSFTYSVHTYGVECLLLGWGCGGGKQDDKVSVPINLRYVERKQI